MNELQATIEQAWENRAELRPGSAPATVGAAVSRVLSSLDAGNIRVAEKTAGTWVVHQWIKKAVLLSFRLEDNARWQAQRRNITTKYRANSLITHARISYAGVPRGAAGNGAARRIHREKCRAHAILCQYRRLRR